MFFVQFEDFVFQENEDCGVEFFRMSSGICSCDNFFTWFSQILRSSYRFLRGFSSGLSFFALLFQFGGVVLIAEVVSDRQAGIVLGADFGVSSGVVFVLNSEVGFSFFRYGFFGDDIYFFVCKVFRCQCYFWECVLDFGSF